jgi:hypothetical protein
MEALPSQLLCPFVVLRFPDETGPGEEKVHQLFKTNSNR